MLEPHPQGCLHSAHGVGDDREPELRVAGDGIPTRESHIVERVGGVEPEVELTRSVDRKVRPESTRSS